MLYIYYLFLTHRLSGILIFNRSGVCESTAKAISRKLGAELVESHTTLLFLSHVHTSGLHICTSVSALHTGSSVPSFSCPYMCLHIQYLFFSFWLTSLSMTDAGSVHISKWCTFVLFHGWVIFHCIYVARLLYQFFCQLTSGLLAHPGYCKYCCGED